MIVEINKSGNISLFKRMNQDVVEQYKRYGMMPTINQHKEKFEEIHGVEILINNSNWTHMVFPSEQDYLMAVLKWL